MLDEPYKSSKALGNTLGLSIFVSLLSTNHVSFGYDLAINLQVSAVYMLGLSIWFYNQKQLYISILPLLSLMLLFALIAIQPFINFIYYPDSLIFPLAAILISILGAVAIASAQNKEKFLEYFFYWMILGLFLSFVIQVFQLFNISWSISNIVIINYRFSDRLSGNLAQPNQLAFMYNLGIVALLWNYEKYALNSKFKSIIYITLGCLFIIGIFWTKSRTGLFSLVISFILYYLLQIQTNKYSKSNVIAKVAIITFTVLILFCVATFLQKVLGNTSTTVDRLTDGTAYVRKSLFLQGYYAFVDHPILGTGWNNYSINSLKYINELPYFMYSLNSHFFLTQIASELGLLGLLCLLPIMIFIIRSFNLKLSSTKSAILVIIILFIVYSTSEYPLWQVRYLIVFFSLIPILNDKHLFKVKVKVNQLMSLICISIFVGSLFYWYSFDNLLKLDKYMLTNNDNIAIKQEKFLSTTFPYGFNNFKETMHFRFMQTDSNFLDEKITIAQRVLSYQLSTRNMVKYAQLLMLKGDTQQSLLMYQYACKIDGAKNCNLVENSLRYSVQHDNNYQELYNNFIIWRKAANDKKIPR